MARAKAPAPMPDPENEIRVAQPPRLDPSAARALANAQEKLGYPVPPIVTASLADDQAQTAAPIQPAAGPAGEPQ